MEMNLVYERAWSFHKTTGLNVEELTDIAMDAYVSAMERFQPTGICKFSTYAHTRITGALKDFCKAQKGTKFMRLDERFQIAEKRGNANMMDISLNMGQFPKHIQEMVKLIFENSDIFDTDHPKKAKGELIKILRAANWTWEDIWSSFKVMKQILATTSENDLFF